MYNLKICHALFHNNSFFPGYLMQISISYLRTTAQNNGTDNLDSKKLGIKSERKDSILKFIAILETFSKHNLSE
jgi:hypothetical protein